MPRYNLSTDNFDEYGYISHPAVDDGVDATKALIKDPQGVEHSIEGFDYASHLLGDAIVCTCGEEIDPHHIALYTEKHRYIVIPARCCDKFRWFRGDEV